MAEGSAPPRPAAQGTASRLPLPPLPPLPSPHGPASLRSPVVLGKVTAALLGLVIAADLFAIWVNYALYDVTSTAGGTLAESLNPVAEPVQLATYLAAGVVFLVWFRRVRVNAEVFSPFGHTFSRAWVGWGWFVPFVNLVRPRRIMAEIWDASRPADTRRGQGLVNTWWTFWIIDALVGRLSFGASGKAETAQAVQDAAFQSLLTATLDIVAAVFAILVVLKLTRMQDRKAHEGPVASGV
jgi:hypothetical protein